MSMIPVVERRSGTLWTVLQFPLTRALLAIGAIAAWIASVQGARRSLNVAPESGWGRVFGLVLIAGVCLVYAAYVRLIERRPVVELALRGAPQAFGKGFVVGAALFSATILELWVIGVYSVVAVFGADALLAPLMSALIAAFVEELLFRGVVFRILEESLGSWLALGLSALVFGVLHAFNPGATWVSTLAIALEAGVLLAAVYMFSRRLWTCIGLHCAWNFAEGGVFGAKVSGSKASGLLASRFQGPDILTGGSFGPEASVVAVLICLAAGVAFVQLARRRGYFVRPFWRRG
ncbi:MAG TPA: CPBP family intramembrane glutamic endopeptidase [Thermoanaerobaculia bacterium]|nr:CPBP family intramembrane glutamic endopeptidase [Thermoanaerobaculia bacterium]